MFCFAGVLGLWAGLVLVEVLVVHSQGDRPDAKQFQEAIEAVLTRLSGNP